jgi:hypothetical protein
MEETTFQFTAQPLLNGFNSYSISGLNITAPGAGKNRSAIRSHISP